MDIRLIVFDPCEIPSITERLESFYDARPGLGSVGFQVDEEV